MLDRIIDLVLSVLHMFKFWIVMEPNWAGVVTRLGKMHKHIGPGVHFFIPLNVDCLWAEEMTPFTETLNPQTLHPKGDDATAVTITPVVTWKVVDVEAYSFKISEGSEAILDLTAGAVGDSVQQCTSEQLFDGTVCLLVSELATARAAEYGVEIIRIQFADAAECGAYRLIGGLSA